MRDWKFSIRKENVEGRKLWHHYAYIKRDPPPQPTYGTPWDPCVNALICINAFETHVFLTSNLALFNSV